MHDAVPSAPPRDVGALALTCAAGAPLAHGGHPWAALGRGQDAPVAERPSADSPPAPRTRVAGLDSLRAISNVRFHDPQAAPRVLEVSLAFPARVRLGLRPEGGKLGERVLRYARCGELYGFGLREATSTRIEGAARSDELLSIEARVAAFVWPEAHAWIGEGAERRAVIAGLGTLVAELTESAVASPADPDGARAPREQRPSRIRALRADGSEVEALAITGWTRFEARDGARAWPRGLTLTVAGAAVWDESVLRVERTVPWADDWFVPPDRRTPRDAAVAGLHAIDLPSAVVRELEVPRVAGQAPSLDAALELARSVAAEERARGRVLDHRIAIGISSALEPRTVRLALADENAAVPEGWRLEPPRPAWLVFFDAVGAVKQRDVDRLLLAAPLPAQDTNASLLLVVTGEPKGGVQLVRVDAAR